MADIDNNIDDILRELKLIKYGIGVSDDTTINQTSENIYAGKRQKINPDNYIIRESDHLEYSNEGGSVTVQSGETRTICELYASSGLIINLLSVGATDEQNVRYALKMDGNIVGGWTNSPIGLVNNPFSFVDEFGASLVAEESVQVIAKYEPESTGSVDLISRIHAEFEEVDDIQYR